MKNLISDLKRFLLSCLCLERCRVCKKELSLSLTHDYSAKPDFQDVIAIEDTKKSEKFGLAFRQSLDFMAQAIATPSVHPALLKVRSSPSFCRQISECLCHSCWLDLEIDVPLIGFCKLRNFAQKQLAVASGAPYETKLRDLIGRFKYDGDRLLALDLTFVMANAWCALMEHMPAQNLLIVPVPLHSHRQHNRGFNQAELLAQHLSFITGIKNVKGLKRIHGTKPQQTLGREERLKNVKGAFKAAEGKIAGRNIILVDDVCTSGATLIECAEELLRRGALSVAAITVARALVFTRTLTETTKDRQEFENF